MSLQKTKTEQVVRQIDVLRHAGYDIKINHLRKYKQQPGGASSPKACRRHDIPKGCIIDNMGGETTIAISSPDRLALFVGKAKCSDMDNFNKSKGLQIAFKRVMKSASESSDYYRSAFFNKISEREVRNNG